ARATVPSSLLTRGAGRLVTFHVVCLGWILFRSDSLASAGELVVGLARWNTPANLVTPTVVAAVALALLYQLAPRSISGSVTTLFARLGPVPQGALIGAGLAGITYLGPSGVPPFIYYRFGWRQNRRTPNRDQSRSRPRSGPPPGSGPRRRRPTGRSADRASV